MRPEQGRMGAAVTTPGQVGEIRLISTSGGTALNQTAVLTRIPAGAASIYLTPHTFTGDTTVVKVAKGPYLTIIKTADDGVSFADYSENAQDGADTTEVTMNSFDTAANGDFLYVGASRKFRGFNVDIDHTNAGSASVLTAKYWNGTAWASLAISDGTSTGGKTFAQDGNITWTIPAGDAWKKHKRIYTKANLYWVRFQTDVIFDSSVDAKAILPLGISTSYQELVTGQPWEEAIERGINGWSTIEALCNGTGTAKLLINAGAGAYHEFPN